MSIETIVTVLVAVGGATWALRSKLSAIEAQLAKVAQALADHVSADAAKFRDHGARIVRLESRRRR